MTSENRPRLDDDDDRYLGPGGKKRQQYNVLDIFQTESESSRWPRDRASANAVARIIINRYRPLRRKHDSRHDRIRRAAREQRRSYEAGEVRGACALPHSVELGKQKMYFDKNKDNTIFFYLD